MDTYEIELFVTLCFMSFMFVCTPCNARVFFLGHLGRFVSRSGKCMS